MENRLGERAADAAYRSFPGRALQCCAQKNRDPFPFSGSRPDKANGARDRLMIWGYFASVFSAAAFSLSSFFSGFSGGFTTL
jgi:hypothetical protein